MSDGAGWFPGPTNSFTALVTTPGLLNAAIQRPRFHWAPISLAVVFKTASAVFFRFSLRVMSGTPAKLLPSALSETITAAVGDPGLAAVPDGSCPTPPPPFPPAHPA